jgi:hypothetical protein
MHEKCVSISEMCTRGKNLLEDMIDTNYTDICQKSAVIRFNQLHSAAPFLTSTDLLICSRVFNIL